MEPETDEDRPQFERGPLEAIWLNLASYRYNFGNLNFAQISSILFHETAFSMLLGVWALIAEFCLLKYSVFDKYPGSPWLLMVPVLTWLIIVAVKLIEKHWLQKGDSPAQRTQRIILCLGLLFTQVLVGCIGNQDREEIFKATQAEGWPFNDGCHILITLASIFIGSCATMTLYRMFFDMVIKAFLFEGFPLVDEDEEDYDFEEEEGKGKKLHQSSRVSFDDNDNIHNISSRLESLLSHEEINQHFATGVSAHIDEHYRN